MSQADAESLFRRACELSADPSNLDEAAGLWPEVIDAYRELGVREPGPSSGRGLARALWRHSLLLLATQRVPEAVAAGEEAVEVFDRVLDQTLLLRFEECVSPAMDQAVADAVRARTDLAQALTAAGRLEERTAVLSQAVAKAVLSGGPLTRRALGTAHHDLSVAELNDFMCAAEGGRGDADPRSAALSASRATEIRRELADTTDPATLWELAGTYTHYAKCLLVLGDGERAVAVVRLARSLVAFDPPLFREIRPRLDQLMRVLRERFPSPDDDL
ncbi:hypothetical protein [Thermomonospora umbrina]|uniref:Tetratricopeptide repeat protein n=1 Tax=Thermomonospora umbrina TaxID=111806 RepID=A0A3D9SP15_9ACTN|nr:hypothetical protein [Thermomonospora umbrina]REE95703.1 hypothetical protein DFJ69_1112 [Thermomonospora umbrina]